MPPDLRKGKDFYNKRVHSLREAVDSLDPGNGSIFKSLSSGMLDQLTNVIILVNIILG